MFQSSTIKGGRIRKAKTKCQGCGCPHCGEGSLTGGDVSTRSDGGYDNRRLTSSQLSSTDLTGAWQHDSKQRQFHPLQMVMRTQLRPEYVPYVPIDYSIHSVEQLLSR